MAEEMILLMVACVGIYIYIDVYANKARSHIEDSPSLVSTYIYSFLYMVSAHRLVNQFFSYLFWFIALWHLAFVEWYALTSY